MPCLNDLPAELITPICGNLDHADIVSLRHTSRALATGSADGFRDASLDSITVTCSKAGLERLEFLMTTNAPAYVNVPERVDQIKHVTITVLTPSRLKELADTCDDSKENPYLLAYTKVRTTLVNALNKLPNLESITITNETFNGVTDPPFEDNDPRFDPIREHDSKVNGDRLAPRCYGFKSALSILSNYERTSFDTPALRSPTALLYLVVDYANVDPALARLPGRPNSVLSPYVVPLSVRYQLRPFTSTRTKKGLHRSGLHEGWPYMDAIQRAMFGVPDLELEFIFADHLNHITFRGQDGAIYGAPEQLSRLTRCRVGLYALAPKVYSITLEDAPEAYGMLKQYSKFGHLRTLRLADTELSKSMIDFLQLHITLTSVVLTRCRASASAWEAILPTLGRAAEALTEQHLKHTQLHLIDCVDTSSGNTFGFQWNRNPDEKMDGPVPAAFLPFLQWVSTWRTDADREAEAVAEQQAIQKQFMAMKV